MRRIITASALAALFVCLAILPGCASCSRLGKNITSDVQGGTEKTVTLYDYQGDKLEEWSGKIDIFTSRNGKMSFDLDGKRTVINGGIVVAQEQ